MKYRLSICNGILRTCVKTDMFPYGSPLKNYCHKRSISYTGVFNFLLSSNQYFFFFLLYFLLYSIIDGSPAFTGSPHSTYCCIYSNSNIYSFYFILTNVNITNHTQKDTWVWNLICKINISNYCSWWIFLVNIIFTCCILLYVIFCVIL